MEQPVHTRTDQRVPSHRKKSYGKLITVLGAAILILLAGAVTLWLVAGADRPKSDRYQAVFLNNNQVFFGKLKNTTGDYLVLENAYYTSSQDLPDDATKEQRDAVNNNVSLVAVGSEVYGPENTLKIRAEQVLFWQDLTSDSKVAQAIDSKQ